MGGKKKERANRAFEQKKMKSVGRFELVSRRVASGGREVKRKAAAVPPRANHWSYSYLDLIPAFGGGVPKKVGVLWA